jgi:hypothetical protein
MARSWGTIGEESGGMEGDWGLQIAGEGCSHKGGQGGACDREGHQRHQWRGGRGVKKALGQMATLFRSRWLEPKDNPCYVYIDRSPQSQALTPRFGRRMGPSNS